MNTNINPIEVDKQSTLESNLEYVIPRYGYSLNGQNILQDPDLPSQFSVINNIYKLPHSPTWFRGLVNQHNTLIPVFDIYSLVNNNLIKARKNTQNNILTIKIDEESVGLIIDDVPVYIEGELKEQIDIESQWSDKINESIKCTYQDKETSWIEISYQKLFFLLANQKF